MTKQSGKGVGQRRLSLCTPTSPFAVMEKDRMKAVLTGIYGQRIRGNFTGMNLPGR